MEKQAVVRINKTPSVLSGKPSDKIVGEEAYTAKEASYIDAQENRLAKSMGALYNKPTDLENERRRT